MFLRIFILFSFFTVSLSAQPKATIEKLEGEIKLDGQLTESSWSNSNPANNFWQYFPSDSVLAQYQTEIYFLYDEKNLYVGVKCFSPGNDYVIPSLRRDFRAGGNDNITLLIDPFNDRINAFLFGTNPAGVQREGLVAGGGATIENFSVSWDNKWWSEAYIGENYWSAELVIPLSILRFNPGVDKWSFNSYRFDTQSNERSTWNRIPRNQWIFNLAFMGDIIWDNAPEENGGGGNAIIPYITGGTSQNFEEGTERNITYNLGGDAKVAVTPSLNLDLTFNPDFSQVEVDRQVTNIDRFEIFFPERRQFFLENADLFGSFGQSRINPFFSRRIGVSRDTTTGNAVQNTIYAGARLSGKLNENFRLGVLSMQTAPDEANGLPNYNYSIVSAQQRIQSRSNVGIIIVNKQAFGEINPDSEYDAFNRVIGIDYNLATDDNTWIGKAFAQRSFSVENGRSPYAQGSFLRYNTRRVIAEFNQQYVGEDYDAQVGFVPRKNFFRINPSVQLQFYSIDGLLNQHGPQLEYEYLNTPGIGMTDQTITLSYEAELSNNARFSGRIENNYIYLINDFDPTGTDSEELLAESSYNFTNLRLSFRSNQQKDFNFSINPTIGQYFNGFRTGVRGDLNFRYQPFGQLRISYAYNYFKMPYLDSGRQTILLGPRLDLTLSKSVFITTVLQYNSQIENMNLNARLQWRFAPVSDFFLVYTDNYFTDFMDDPSNRFLTEIRNRSIVAKLTYWLNI